jgi:hypothetical protein
VPDSHLSRLGDSLTAADALDIIAGWTDLPPARRRALSSDIHTIVRMAGLPASNVLLTPPWLRQHVLRNTAATYGISEARMRNLRSALRFVLRRMGMMDPAAEPLSPPWSAILEHMDEHARAGLTGFARYCSLRAVTPANAHEVADDFLAHLVERSLDPRPRKQFGRIRMVWQRCCDTIEGWPGQPFPRPTDGGAYILPIEAFPETFRNDLAAFGERLAGTFFDDAEPIDGLPPMRTGKNIRGGRRPLRACSVALRQSHIRWAASALVATGSVQRMGDHAALANRSFWLACG